MYPIKTINPRPICLLTFSRISDFSLLDSHSSLSACVVKNPCIRKNFLLARAWFILFLLLFVELIGSLTTRRKITTFQLTTDFIAEAKLNSKVEDNLQLDIKSHVYNTSVLIKTSLCNNFETNYTTKVLSEIHFFRFDIKQTYNA